MQGGGAGKADPGGMAQMLKNIDALQLIQTRCAANEPLTPDLQTWLAASIGRYLQRDCETLNEAFGLIQSHGGVPWWRERAMRERDAALRVLARRHCGDLSIYARARLITEWSERYESVCWPRDRLLVEMPERYRGTPKEFLWRAFRTGAKMPVSERRLRTLIAD